MIAGRAKVQADNRAPRNAGVEVGGVGVTNGTGARGAAAASTASDAIPRDLTVTALRFHQHNGDVLAVGYGVFFFSPSAQRGGAVLFWSVSFVIAVERAFTGVEYILIRDYIILR